MAPIRQTSSDLGLRFRRPGSLANRCSRTVMRSFGDLNSNTKKTPKGVWASKPTCKPENPKPYAYKMQNVVHERGMLGVFGALGLEGLPLRVCRLQLGFRVQGLD